MKGNNLHFTTDFVWNGTKTSQKLHVTSIQHGVDRIAKQLISFYAVASAFLIKDKWTTLLTANIVIAVKYNNPQDFTTERMSRTSVA